MRAFYTAVYYLAIPFILIRLLWRSRHSQGYRSRWNERLGFAKPITSKNSIWIHAVSVGEVIAATPLIKAIIKKYTDQYAILVTTTTPTGSELVIKHFADQVHHVYLPFDTPTAVNRFLKRVCPAIGIIMETELWPNLYHCCKKKHIPIIIANGRLSERSCSGYQRITKVTTEILSACHMLLAQSNADGQRFIKLGLNQEKLIVSGNIKFDMTIPNSVIADGQAVKASIGNRLALIAASTHEGEEEIILDAFTKIREQVPNLFLILVPRHVNRFEKVAALCIDRNWKIAQRSKKTPIEKTTDILLVDTIGELRMIYAAADIAFVGGSLVPIGGHNLIEPAVLGLPILTGPNLQNFTEIGRLLKSAKAAQIVVDANTLSETVTALCQSQEHRSAMGQRALTTINDNRGALQKHLDCIESTLSKQQSHIPK